MSSSSPLTISTIGVIVGLDLVGDALIKLPFVRALKKAFPEATLHWITSKGPTAYNGPLRDLTQHLIDVIHEQPAWLSTSEDQSPHFDLLIDTRGRWKEAGRVRKTIPHKLFIAPAFRFLVSDRRPPLFQKRPVHLVDKLLQLVDLAGGTYSLSSERLPLSDLMLLKARQIMPKGVSYIGFAPGAGNPIKIWPLANFVEVAQHQAAQGRVPVFLLGPQEEDWMPEIKQAVPTALFPLQARKVWGAPDITIEQTLAVGSLLTVAVTNDSGTGHMLAAVDCPLITLFGPTSPEKLAPRVTRGTVIRAQDFGGDAMEATPPDVVKKTTDRIILLLNPP